MMTHASRVMTFFFLISVIGIPACSGIKERRESATLVLTRPSVFESKSLYRHKERRCKMASPLTEKQQQDIERTWSLVEGDMQGAGFLMFKR